MIYQRMIEFCKNKKLPYIVIDTSNLTPDEVVDTILKELKING